MSTTTSTITTTTDPAAGVSHETPTEPTEPRTRVRHSGPDHPLTDAEAEALAGQVSDDPIPLDPDDLACGDCGRVVSGPFDLAAVHYAEPVAYGMANGVVSTSTATPPPEPLITCTACAARRGLAADLAARLLPGGISVGGLHRADAAPVVGSALAVLDLLAHPMPDPAALSPEVLVLTVRRLAPLGGGLGWSGRFAPIRHAEARPGTANPRPWAHVRHSIRTEARRAVVAVMADRLALSAPAVTLAPPSVPAREIPADSMPPALGCLLCGVGAVTIPAREVAAVGGRDAAARQVWTLRTSIRPDSLGGRPSPLRLIGHTCPACSAALDYAGAVGPTAMERALIVTLDLSHRWPTGAELPGLRAWGALVADAHTANPPRPGPAPNPTANPWAHLGDLDALRDELARDLGRG